MGYMTSTISDLFEPLESLQQLRLDRMMDIQCVPDSSATYIKLDARSAAEGTCECTPATAVSCPYGTTCFPGRSGYTCLEDIDIGCEDDGDECGCGDI
ncbi:unnamed protein product [Ectocarpus fasciculatus]